ncbi:MAG TPA: RNA pseudouridine synthase [Microscillaceae bacterium]|jgi:23S rRNA pseudouridine955/2504/2580 synthase|nr:RNA pseudouridine synthase [Microscillaceae bacterium]
MEPSSKQKKQDFAQLIVFENDDYILVNKPPRFPTLHERSDPDKQSILEMARDYCADAQVCHRLDKETSGILAIAKNAEAYRHLSLQFEHRQVAKIYHAVVHGIHDFDYISVNLPILPLKTGLVKIDYQEGKEAQTFFKTLEAFKQHSLVECRPLTGRMHQIRIHLSILKAPIVGDKQYGGRDVFLSQIKRGFNLKKNTEEQPLIQRFALHAQCLEFTLLDNTPLQAVAPYPKDIDALLKQLRKNT